MAYDQTTSDVETLLKAGDFPFRCEFSLRELARRLTQPGRIAIVYGHSAEAAEYRDYVEYLQSLGCLIAGDVEELDVDELQGVRGLRALRVGIDVTNPRLEHPVSAGDLEAR
jgi:hypothetical protein